MTTLLSGIAFAARGPAINPAQLSYLIGARMQVAATQVFDGTNGLVALERAAITANDNSDFIPNGQEYQIFGELGHRKWTKSTALSTPADNAAASHLRVCVLPGGKQITLDGDANTVTATASGTPSGGNDGDIQIYEAAGFYYKKIAGNWTRQGPLQTHAHGTYVECVTTGADSTATENTSRLYQAQLDSLRATGNRSSTLIVGPGQIVVDNLPHLPHVRIIGLGSAYAFSSPTSGTVFTQPAGSTNPIISVSRFISGTSDPTDSAATLSNRGFSASIENVSIRGNGTLAPNGLLYIRNQSYFYSKDIHVQNTLGPGIVCSQTWDSTFSGFTRICYAGSLTSGVDYPALDIRIESGDTDTCNNLTFEDLHIEPFPGMACRIAGNNTSKLYFKKFKFESGPSYSTRPYFYIAPGVRDCHFVGNIAGTGFASNVIDCLLKLAGTTSIKGDISLFLGGSVRPHVRAFADIKTSSQMGLLIDIPVGSAEVAPDSGYIVDWDGAGLKGIGHMAIHHSIAGVKKFNPAYGDVDGAGAWRPNDNNNITISSATTIGYANQWLINTCTGNPTCTFPSTLSADFSADFDGQITADTTAWGGNFVDKRSTGALQPAATFYVSGTKLIAFGSAA